jgi:hypothetical protein
VISQRCSSIFVILVLLCASAPVVGQFTVDATVGLDEQTRELINRLPANVREQVLATLKDALPLLDKSVDGYLAKVNDILDHQIDHAQCAATGVIAEVDRRVKLPLTREKGPLEIFDDFEKSELGRIRQSSSAAFYARVYGDLFNEATVTYCEMEISGAAENARDDENRYRLLSSTWFRLRNTCSDVSDCVTNERSAVQNTIKGSDIRDVQLVRASERLAKVAEPKAPGFFQSFDVKPYNIALI